MTERSVGFSSSFSSLSSFSRKPRDALSGRLYLRTNPSNPYKPRNRTTQRCRGSDGAALAQSSRPPRFYVDGPLHEASEGDTITLPDDESRHALRSLRLKRGAVLEICDGLGTTALGELATEESRGPAVVRLLASPRSEPQEQGLQWTVAVACGSLKGGRADWLVEKCTELNAYALQPLLTERSPSMGTKATQKRRAKPSSDDDRPGGRASRWDRVALAAMKQCLRKTSLQVLPPCNVDQVCQQVISNADVALIGVEGAPAIGGVMDRFRVDMRESERSTDDCTFGKPMRGVVIVGPEGDFTPGELERICAAGAIPVGLGNTRLRTETAVVALLSYASLALVPLLAENTCETAD